jgi:hypothetical protein
VHRHPGARRLTSWLFVAALLLKSAVPMLASAAAGLQGKATAEVCDVYGVDMSSRDAHAHHADHAGHAHHVHGDAMAADSAPAPSPHGPTSRVGHGDHCALSALAFAIAAETSAPAAPLAEPLLALSGHGHSAAPVDAAARWAAQLRHGPPPASS